MSAATLLDPRDVISDWADRVDHIACDACWKPGMPMMCGMPDNGGKKHPENCGHPTCSMCELEWRMHQCPN